MTDHVRMHACCQRFSILLSHDDTTLHKPVLRNVWGGGEEDKRALKKEKGQGDEMWDVVPTMYTPKPPQYRACSIPRARCNIRNRTEEKPKRNDEEEEKRS